MEGIPIQIKAQIKGNECSVVLLPGRSAVWQTDQNEARPPDSIGNIMLFTAKPEHQTAWFPPPQYAPTLYRSNLLLFNPCWLL